MFLQSRGFFKNLLIGLGILIVLSVLYVGQYLREVAPMTSGFVAHTICSNIFIAGRDLGDIENNDLTAQQRRATHSEVDGQSVKTRFQVGPISFTHTALYRPGLGCTLVVGTTAEQLLQTQIEPVREFVPDDPAWLDFGTGTENAKGVKGVKNARLEAVIDEAFNEQAANTLGQKKTRAVVIVQDGKLLSERYAKGFDAGTPLRGMSMTKSLTSALIGILVGQGKLDIKQAANIAQWQGAGDPRQQITVEHLLQMTSGMKFKEVYEADPTSDANRMLFNTGDIANFAAELKLQADPGRLWSYQTPNSCLLGQIIRETMASDVDYYRFAQEALFNRIGMRSSYLQADAAGTFVGGVFMYASARDWARFGWLYLNDGVWQGQRILPEGWVDYSQSASLPSLQAKAYGAQFWLNSAAVNQWMPGLPEDIFAARGHYGQALVIVPSRKLLIVRMGMTFNTESWDLEGFVSQILSALPQEQD